MYIPHLGIYIKLGISRYRLEPDDRYIDSEEHYRVKFFSVRNLCVLKKHRNKVEIIRCANQKS